MTNPAAIIDRVRALGANIVLEGDQLVLVNRSKLPAKAMAFIRQHRAAVAKFLLEDQKVEFEERAAIIEFGSGAPRDWAEQFAKILIDRRPAGVNDLDWSYFLTACGRILDETPSRRAA